MHIAKLFLGKLLTAPPPGSW